MFNLKCLGLRIFEKNFRMFNWKGLGFRIKDFADLLLKVVPQVLGFL